AAQLAGRREFGTYAFTPLDATDDPDAPPGSALMRYLGAPERPEALEELFLLAEAVRVHGRLSAEYRGLAGEGRWVAERLLAHWAALPAPTRTQRLDAIFAVVLRGADAAPLPEWLAGDAAELIVRCVVPLGRPEATVDDAMRVAET